MSYIGREPQVGNFQVCDAISVVNGQAAYTMQVSSVNVSPETANHMLVSLNGVLQAPGSSYTVSGSTITFASNLVTGDVINFIHILGSVLDLGVPSDSTVSLAKLTATGTKDATTFLRGDNTFATAAGGKILQVVSATDGSTRTTTSTSFVTASTTLTLNITPSATSSKILIMVAGVGQMGTTAGFASYYTIFKGGSNIVGNEGMAVIGVGEHGAGYVFSSMDIKYIDSPSTTNAVTYDVRVRSENGSNAVIGAGGSGATDSIIIAMEIGA